MDKKKYVKFNQDGIKGVDKINEADEETISNTFFKLDWNGLYLKTGNGAYDIQLGLHPIGATQYLFSAINNSTNTRTFSIDANGNAYFSGTLNAASGSFAGDISAATGTFSGNIQIGYLSSNYGQITINSQGLYIKKYPSGNSSSGYGYECYFHSYGDTQNGVELWYMYNGNPVYSAGFYMRPNGPVISLNGDCGSSGQVITSNGTKAFWGSSAATFG